MSQQSEIDSLADILFEARKSPVFPADKLKLISKLFGVAPAQALQIRTGLTNYIKTCISNPKLSDRESISFSFPAGLLPPVHQAAVSSAISAKISTWRGLNMVQSMPCFRGVEWSIDMKSASNTVTRMSIPTALVRITLDNPGAGERQDVVFELSQGPLQVMLEGLGKIRDQLSGIAG